MLRGVAFPLHRCQGADGLEGLGAWGEVDTSGLSISQDRLAGRIVVRLLRPWVDSVNSRLRARGGEKYYRPYEMKPEGPLAISLDVKVSNHEGLGAWSAEATDSKAKRA